MKRIFNVAVVALLVGAVAVSCNSGKSMVTKGNTFTANKKHIYCEEKTHLLR